MNGKRTVKTRRILATNPVFKSLLKHRQIDIENCNIQGKVLIRDLLKKPGFSGREAPRCKRKLNFRNLISAISIIMAVFKASKWNLPFFKANSWAYDRYVQLCLDSRLELCSRIKAIDVKSSFVLHLPINLRLPKSKIELNNWWYTIKKYFLNAYMTCSIFQPVNL